VRKRLLILDLEASGRRHLPGVLFFPLRPLRGLGTRRTNPKHLFWANRPRPIRAASPCRAGEHPIYHARQRRRPGAIACRRRAAVYLVYWGRVGEGASRTYGPRDGGSSTRGARTAAGTYRPTRSSPERRWQPAGQASDASSTCHGGSRGSTKLRRRLGLHHEPVGPTEGPRGTTGRGAGTDIITLASAQERSRRVTDPLRPGRPCVRRGELQVHSNARTPVHHP